MPLDLRTAGHLKWWLIDMVCSTSGVYLLQQHAILQDKKTTMPLPYDMPFQTLLEHVPGKELNLWINVWTPSYRFALRHQALNTAPPAGLTATTAGVPVIYTPGDAPGSRRRLSPLSEDISLG